MKRNSVVVFLAISFFLCVANPFFAHAAQIYFDPVSGKYPPGVTFAVNVRLDNQNQCVNAAEVNISYPKDQLQAVAASDGDSIFSLWVKTPTIYADYGLISFAGGLPGGYCGRVAGDATLSNKLATLYFRIPTSTTAASATLLQPLTLSFATGTEAILSDGAGTEAKLTMAQATYSALLTGKYVPLDLWQNAITNDTVPPEPFTVSTYRDPSLFDDQWFAVFSTVDNQTGIDHYEVAEVSAADVKLPQNQWNWTRAISPYLIKDQSMASMIAVRAIDAAGNVRVETYTPTPQPVPSTNKPLAILPYLAIIGVVALTLWRLVLRLLV